MWMRHRSALRRVRRSQAARHACGGALALLVLLATLGVSPAHADSSAKVHDTFVIPPAPSAAAPRLALEIHSGIAWALSNESLCPRGVGCVMRGGGGIGATIERRWPKGLGAFAGYDAWFLDSDSVYELGVQQALRGGARYTLPTDIVFHPVFEVGAGLMGYGDTFRIATVGGLGQLFAGGELELSETFGLRAGFGLRAFTHTSFTTQRDNVERGRHGAFSEAVYLEVGLTVM
jgi:hypothetical protein